MLSTQVVSSNKKTVLKLRDPSFLFYKNPCTAFKNQCTRKDAKPVSACMAKSLSSTLETSKYAIAKLCIDTPIYSQGTEAVKFLLLPVLHFLHCCF
jgi:hypothetical protein